MGQDQRAASLGALLRIAVALQNLPLDLIIAGPERLEIYAQGDETDLQGYDRCPDQLRQHIPAEVIRSKG